MSSQPRDPGDVSRKLMLGLCALLTQISCTAGPGRTTDPAGGEPPPITVAGTYPVELATFMDVGTGTFTWRWSPPDSRSSQPATLITDGRHWSWRLVADAVDAGLPERICLAPDEPDIWHSFETRTDTLAPGAWFPLLRLTVRSPYYHDLLALLQELIAPRFDQRVCHWYRRPVPVGADPAVSGSVDLAACFHDAVAIWNAGAETALFAWIPDTALGTRLLHLPGQNLRPPMSASLVQRDEQGRALRLQIRVGDTYDDPVDELYARRGFVHELAHALLLWGHSLDREHILWRCGPIVDRPSDDERRA
ncbi:hypothetical protein KKA85_07665, partial [bacterium]|nr:hypothetical protein [bacterium]